MVYTIPNATGGFDNFLVGVATEVPLFPIMFLFAVWIVIFISGMVSQGLRSAYADAPMWSTVAFMSVTIMALIMSLTAGIISPIVLSLCMGLTLFSALWLFLSKGRFEN